jgi:hypothetical protein
MLLKEQAQKIRKNATDVVEAVRKTSEELSDFIDQINDALREITVLQVICLYELVYYIYFYFAILKSKGKLLSQGRSGVLTMQNNYLMTYLRGT